VGAGGCRFKAGGVPDQDVVASRCVACVGRREACKHKPRVNFCCADGPVVIITHAG